MKIKLLALGLLSLSLLACGTRNVRDASPSTDLQLVRIGVKHLTEKRKVEGTIQHRDEAADNGQLWNFTGRLADKSLLDDGDKDQLRSFMDEALDAIESGRQVPCRSWDVVCRWRRFQATDPTPGP